MVVQIRRMCSWQGHKMPYALWFELFIKGVVKYQTKEFSKQMCLISDCSGNMAWCMGTQPPPQPVYRGKTTKLTQQRESRGKPHTILRKNNQQEHFESCWALKNMSYIKVLKGPLDSLDRRINNWVIVDLLDCIILYSSRELNKKYGKTLGRPCAASGWSIWTCIQAKLM